jgi:hypothetical protein
MWIGVHEKILLSLEGNVAFSNSGISAANLLDFMTRPLF